MFQNLNDKYYALFSDLYASRAVLPPKQYDIMAGALYTEYKRELSMIVGDVQLQTAREAFELKFKLSLYIPRRFLFWSNKVARAYIKDCKVMFRRYLEDLSAGYSPSEDPSPVKEESVAVVPVSIDLQSK